MSDRAGKNGSAEWMLDAARWAASDLALELGNRPRWLLVEENHGGTPTLRAFTIANRFPLPVPERRPIVDITPRQLTLEVA